MMKARKRLRNWRDAVATYRAQEFLSVYLANCRRTGRPYGGGGYLPNADEQAMYPDWGRDQ